MLDFNHILSTPGYNFQQFVGNTSSALGQFQTWVKPRGVKFIYLIGVGGGGSGGNGRNNSSVSSGGGGGGASGSQSSVLMPASFIPDTLYVQTGQGGISVITSGGAGTAGQPTYVLIEPSTTLAANMTLLYATGGGGGQGAAGAAGTAGTAGAVATIANMPLAGRGTYTFFAGQNGTAGGGGTTFSSGTSITLPATGLMVTGGAGGGGASATAAGAVGGNIDRPTGALGQDFFPFINGGSSATTTVSATAGGIGIISRNNLLNLGGTGGGGANSTSAAGLAGAGGNGAPGCGGGGAGGANATNVATLAKPGDGGPGFVYIISW